MILRISRTAETLIVRSFDPGALLDRGEHDRGFGPGHARNGPQKLCEKVVQTCGVLRLDLQKIGVLSRNPVTLENLREGDHLFREAGVEPGMFDAHADERGNVFP